MPAPGFNQLLPSAFRSVLPAKPWHIRLRGRFGSGAVVIGRPRGQVNGRGRGSEPLAALRPNVLILDTKRARADSGYKGGA
jgi:hypothetical protein